ncbi:MAG: carbohydrate ABC transporter permease [Anaerolineae bacterium]|nr:carbohydrate ABC transporter permease [Anaerolineae bacterium]NUQ05536.1 carbohydrate ABC transporter permease [Anaerolineae bacterium]
MAATSATSPVSPAVNTSPFYGMQLRKFTTRALVTLFACMMLGVYLLPFANMAMVALSTPEQLSQAANESVIPSRPITFTYEGEAYDVYIVPLEDGTTARYALIDPGRRNSDMIDINNPDAGVFEWEGNWRTLTPVREVSFAWENFGIAYEAIDFPRLFGNTLFIAVAGMIGTLLSCIAVAYAFARFPIPGKNILFIILIGTIILPTQVTLIPTYAFFAAIGWTNSWLPLIVPHFFANAYNVFLLRQYFMTLPRELDEAAMIDGAGPFKILLRVIIPQSWPAIIAVAVFHFVWAWNDYFGPLIYLIGKPELHPVSVGVQVFNFQYGPRPELVQATSMMALILPLIIFFLAQRVFMRGVVITGVEK